MILKNNIYKSRENPLQHNNWKCKLYEIRNFEKLCNLEDDLISVNNGLPNISDGQKEHIGVKTFYLKPAAWN